MRGSWPGFGPTFYLIKLCFTHLSSVEFLDGGQGVNRMMTSKTHRLNGMGPYGENLC